jgi:type II restriction/modification system DNA methylase subunit YeeA
MSRFRQILTAKEQDAKADVRGLEQQIDALVYELYGLTDEEIAMVEGR